MPNTTGKPGTTHDQEAKRASEQYTPEGSHVREHVFAKRQAVPGLAGKEVEQLHDHDSQEEARLGLGE